jgi:hypothetical protein
MDRGMADSVWALGRWCSAHFSSFVIVVVVLSGDHRFCRRVEGFVGEWKATARMKAAVTT